jgi:hypothetical protein
MAAGTFTFYDTAASVLADDGDVTTANAMRVALIGATYTPSAAHSLFSQVSASELGTTNTGYTAGGKTLSAPVLTDITNGVKFSSDATGGIQWTAGSADLPTWKYAVMYFNGTVAGRTSPVIGYFEGNSGSTVPATTNTNTLTINCPSGGWFDITHA